MIINNFFKIKKINLLLHIYNKAIFFLKRTTKKERVQGRKY